jgi:hypothetical protein
MSIKVRLGRCPVTGARGRRCSECGCQSPTEVDFDHRVLICKPCSRKPSHQGCTIKPLKSSFPPHKLKIVNFIISSPASTTPGPQGHYLHIEPKARNLEPSTRPSRDRTVPFEDNDS